jgi:hypothetical protein
MLCFKEMCRKCLICLEPEAIGWAGLHVSDCNGRQFFLTDFLSSCNNIWRTRWEMRPVGFHFYMYISQYVFKAMYCNKIFYTLWAFHKEPLILFTCCSALWERLGSFPNVSGLAFWDFYYIFFKTAYKCSLKKATWKI